MTEALIGAVVAVVLAMFGLAVSRPRVAIQITQFVESVGISMTLVSAGICAGAYSAKRAVMTHAKWSYGVEGFDITTEPGPDMEGVGSGVHILTQIAEMVDPVIERGLYAGIAAVLLVVIGRAATKLAEKVWEDDEQHPPEPKPDKVRKRR